METQEEIVRTHLEGTGQANPDGRTRAERAAELLAQGRTELLLVPDDLPFAPHAVAAETLEGETLGYLGRNLAIRVREALSDDPDPEEDGLPAVLLRAEGTAIEIGIDAEDLPDDSDDADDNPLPAAETRGRNGERNGEKKEKPVFLYIAIAIACFYFAYRSFAKG